MSYNFLKICDTKIAESVNKKFGKLLLGVNKRAVNHAVRGKIGKYPVAIGLIMHSLKFWLRTVNCDSSSLAWKAYAENYSMDRSGTKSWITLFRKFCSSLSLNQVWDNQGSKHTNMLCSNILNNLKCLYEKQWLENLDYNLV